MSALIRAELIRLRTLRSTSIAAIATVGLTAFIALAAMSDAGSEGMRTVDQLREPVLVAAGFLTALCVAVLGIVSSAGEYRHGTMAQRLLASPRRRDVLLSKCATHAVVGAAVGIAALAVGLAIAQPLAAAEGVSLGLSASAVIAMAGAVAAGTALFGVLGVVMGFALRSQVAGVSVLIGALVAEKLLGGLLGPVAQVLPFDLLQALLNIGGGADAAAAGLFLAAFTLPAGLAALHLLRIRDVT